MAITPPIMTYPLGTDYYDVEVFNTNWKNTLTHTDMLFENGVGAEVLGYIEDGATHTAGTVWLSKFNKGIYYCIVTNSDNFIDVTPGAEKWYRIDDYANKNKLGSTFYGTATTPDSLISSFNTANILLQENSLLKVSFKVKIPGVYTFGGSIRAFSTTASNFNLSVTKNNDTINYLAESIPYFQPSYYNGIISINNVAMLNVDDVISFIFDNSRVVESQRSFYFILN